MRKFRQNIIMILTIALLSLSISVGITADDHNPSDYQLKEVVVLSRHNIRAPLSGPGSAVDTATPHTWYEWSADTSELSLRGGILETAMGQYFRKWLEEEELIPANYRPEGEEVRFYANAKQRTIATTQYFSSGMLPVANIDIITRQTYDQMDPVFTPQLTFVSDEYIKDATAQMKQLIPDLTDEFSLLTDTIDMKESEDYKSGKISDFDLSDTEFVLEVNKEPGMTGSLRTALSLSDALVLQYYEEEDARAAAFGHDLSEEDWKSISYIKDAYGDILFSAPLICVNAAHPLLQEIDSELKNNERVFSFLCGHDSNLTSVLAALNVKDYDLPQAIECKTPIGSKLVFAKYEKDKEEYIDISLVYNSTDQLRDLSILTGDNQPVTYHLEFNGLKANEDGMYRYDDFMNHLEAAINEYDNLYKQYCPQEADIPKTGIE